MRASRAQAPRRASARECLLSRGSEFLTLIISHTLASAQAEGTFCVPRFNAYQER